MGGIEYITKGDYARMEAELKELRDELVVSKRLLAEFMDAAEISPKDLEAMRISADSLRKHGLKLKKENDNLRARADLMEGLCDALDFAIQNWQTKGDGPRYDPMDKLDLCEQTLTHVRRVIEEGSDAVQETNG